MPNNDLVHKRVPRQAKSPHCMLCVSVFKAHTASVLTCGTSILGVWGTNPKKFWTQPCATSGLKAYGCDRTPTWSYMYCSHRGIHKRYWLMAEGSEPAPQMFGSMQIATSSDPSSKALSRWQTAQGQGGIKEMLQGWTLQKPGTGTVSWTQNIFHGTVGPAINLLLNVRSCCLNCCFNCMML